MVLFRSLRHQLLFCNLRWLFAGRSRRRLLFSRSLGERERLKAAGEHSPP